MNTIAEFTIIGRVGEIKQVGTTLRVSVASSYSRKDNRGEWVERTRWNEVTVFGESTRGYVKRNIVKGDLVFTSGSMGQTKWEKDRRNVLRRHARRANASSACARVRTTATTRTMSRRKGGQRRLMTPTSRSECLNRGGLGLPDFALPYRRRHECTPLDLADRALHQQLDSLPCRPRGSPTPRPTLLDRNAARLPPGGLRGLPYPL